MTNDELIIQNLSRQVGELREALEIYANEKNWKSPSKDSLALVVWTGGDDFASRGLGYLKAKEALEAMEAK